MGFLGLGSKSKPYEKALARISLAPFQSSTIQNYLPPSLRIGKTGRTLSAGMEGIGQLIRQPGGLSPNVAEAILPRVSAESEQIAREFRGIKANQMGAAARSNLPVSIRNALNSALDVAQQRAQRGAHRSALSESESLRRSDLGETYKILDAILQFMSAGKGQAISGLGAAGGLAERRDASQMALVGSLISAASTPGAFRGAK